MIFYEVFLIPLIYFKMIYHIIKHTHTVNMVIYMAIWIPLGLLILVLCVIKDMFYFIKILCDFKDENDEIAEKTEADFLQD